MRARDLLVGYAVFATCIAAAHLYGSSDFSKGLLLILIGFAARGILTPSPKGNK